MPSMTAWGSVSSLWPRGQMTETAYPARCSEVASCHTRRSKGTERFSTRIAALPSDTDVHLLSPALDNVGEADEIHHAQLAFSCDCPDGVRAVRTHDADLGMVDGFVRRVHHEVGQVRQVLIHVCAVRTDKTRNRDRFVV